jgi:hypothetical protein
MRIDKLMESLQILIFRCLIGCAMALGSCAHAQMPQQAPAAQEDLYLNALRSLTDGKPDQATALLMRLLAEQPQHAGAWLDLAITQCELGHAAEAEQLFREIEVRFTPPPGIVALIQSYRERGCNLAPAQRSLLGIRLGRGHDSNVNQGASNRFFSTGTGLGYTEWELAPDYLPQADSYTVVSGDYTRPLDDKGTLAVVQLRMLRHDTASAQDTTSVLVGLERPWQAGMWHGRSIAALGLIRLDNQLYQRQTQLHMRVAPPLTLPERVDWSITAGLSHVEYPTRNRYDASTLDLGTALSYSGARTQAQLSLGMLSDHGQSGRLGGDRQGWYGGVQLHARLTDKIKGELGWTRQHWLSQTAYSPGLIDLVRHQDTRQLRAAVIVPLQQGQSLQFEWRQVRNKENISLFQYNSRMLQISWRWDTL